MAKENLLTGPSVPLSLSSNFVGTKSSLWPCGKRSRVKRKKGISSPAVTEIMNLHLDRSI